MLGDRFDTVALALCRTMDGADICGRRCDPHTLELLSCSVVHAGDRIAVHAKTHEVNWTAPAVARRTVGGKTCLPLSVRAFAETYYDSWRLQLAGRTKVPIRAR